MDDAPFLSTIPPHVPADRVYDFDLAYDPLLKPDPHRGLLKLAKLAPEIFYTPRYGGHWVVQSHEAIFEITHDTETFSSVPSASTPQLPIASDPPEHEAYRHVLLKVFSPRAVNAILPRINELAVELVNKVADKGRCEFVTDVSEPLPVIIFMTMLGLPLEMMAPLRKLIIEALNQGDYNDRQKVFDRQLELLNPVIEARMAERQDDMLSRIIDADLAGRHPTMDEIQRYLLLLANAGLDTVVNAMSYAALHLAQDQALQARVRAEPALIPDLVEEFFRRYSVSSIGRRVTRDVQYRGVSLKAGERMHVLLQAANLDASIFPEPDQIALRREAPPVTFGTGIHRCLGSHLARIEVRTVLTEFLTRIPTFRLDAEVPPEMHAGMVYTVDSLPLVWATA